MEQWRPVLGWEGLYEVSDQGRVRRIAADRLGRKSRCGATVKPVQVGAGYQCVSLRDSGRHERRYIHRMVVESFRRPIAPGETVNHLNGNRTDNRAENLEVGAHSANIRHSYDHLGRARPDNHGDRNPNAKLTAAQVDEIRAAYRTMMDARPGRARMRRGWLTSKAQQYGVAPVTIQQAIARRTWTT